MLSEAGLVSHIKRLAASQKKQPGLIKGIGDDCAIVRPRPRHDLVFTTDFVLEGRHFTLDTHKAADIGHKALARSLSDLAAMGSRPLFCLVSLAIPPGLGKAFVDGFYKGLLRLAAQHGIALAGGDLASFDRVIADVLCCGEVAKGKALLRSNARPGDALFVSGQLGGSAHGFRTGKGRNFQRHLRPDPRVNLGRTLSGFGVTCCMDISDGLALDLHRLCKESGVSAVVDGRLPTVRGATQEDVLIGGEDYELLFSAPKKISIPTMIEGVPVTKIGVITKGNPGNLKLGGQNISPEGFDHFSAKISEGR